MILDEKVQSVLRLNNLYYEELFFKRNSNSIANDKVNISASFEVNEITDLKYEVKLKLRLEDEDKLFEVRVVLVGNFEIAAEFPKEQRDILIQKNTVAIMFPYVRSQVTLITSQPGMEPIIIPPININALIEKAQG